MSTSPSPSYDDEISNLKNRVCESVIYTVDCDAKGVVPAACSHFKVPICNDTKSLLYLLRKAQESGFITFIYGSPDVECYSVGIPPPPRYLHEPDHSWFANASRAEMRAGPIRTDADVDIAEREVKRMLERRKKSETRGNGRLRFERDTLMVGLKRQILRLPMEGELDDEDVERAMEEHRAEYEAIEWFDESDEAGPEEDQDAIIASHRTKRNRIDSGSQADAGKVLRQTQTTKKSPHSSQENPKRRKPRKSRAIGKR